MQNEILNDKNQERRRVPMLVNIVKSVKYLLVLAVLLILIVPIKAWAGKGPDFEVPDTDESGFALANFWDLRDRVSTVQITNVCTHGIRVHVQIFNVADDCDEFDFFDNFTENDTHVYDLLDLTAEDKHQLFPPDFSPDGYGIFAVQVVDGLGTVIDDECIVGSMRIVDDDGYEYRSNSASFDENDEPETDEYVFNFNNVDGSVFSDVVGMVLDNFGLGGSGIDELFNANVWVEFETTLFDDQENPNSCSNFVFACTPSDGILVPLILFQAEDASLVGFDLGINDAPGLPNSKGEPSICNGSNDVGFVFLEIDDSGSEIDGGVEDWFVGFIGLNNGDSTGSFDVFWGTEHFED